MNMFDNLNCGQRATIKAMYLAGKTTGQIARHYGVPRSTISRVLASKGLVATR
jgi:DNA-binding transcriptional regulator LsrR (DeoR family)